MDDKNTEYEKLIQEIYQSIINQSGVNTVEVKHNVKIVGRSGAEHQIDVYWEYELAGVRFRTLIECKNWKNHIEIGNVRNFFGVLTDIGNVQGIMVTKTGYQSGALRFAKYYGIKLEVTRKPSEVDWAGRVKDIVINMSMVVSDVSNINFIPNQEQVTELLKEKELEQFQFQFEGMEDELFLYDKQGNRLFTIYDWKQELHPGEWDEVPLTREKHCFEDEVFIKSDIGLVLIDAIEYDYQRTQTNHVTKIEGEKIVRAFRENVETGKKSVFDDKGIVRDIEEDRNED